MAKFSLLLVATVLAASVLAMGLAGCAQGPGHTRAAGTIGGTALGAMIGSSASCPGDRTEGALIGGALGLIAGSMAGDAIASDQEAARYGPPPPPPQPVYYYAAPPPPVYYYGPPPPGSYYVVPAR